MNDPGPDQPYILWALGAAMTAVVAGFSGLIYHIFGTIRQSRVEAAAIANDVREELLRTQEAADRKLEAIRLEWQDRWREGREDRNQLRAEMREYHQMDLAQHAEISKAVTDMPERIVNLLRDLKRD